MHDNMYLWRKMTPEQRADVLRQRKLEGRPWHHPVHRASSDGRYLITAACFEHRPVLGLSAERMGGFETELVEVCRAHATDVWAWVVLPNHYHVLLHTEDVLGLLADIGRLHGRTSHRWNGEEQVRGRQVWSGATETAMKSDRHFWATVNYIHHNPVKHGYVERWQDWPFGSAREYLDGVGRDEAERIWHEYPVGDYGKGWDE